MMDDQEIIDNAPPKQGKWPDCNQVDSDGKWSHRQPLIRSLVDIKELVELRKANSELEKEHNTLTEFADWALDAIFTGSDICGDDAQDKMFELGMLTREIYDPEVHTLSQGSECDAGDYIYFKALKAGN
jgi:hypothetical protein